MKVNTIEQYYILQWLEENFYTEALEMNLVDRNTIHIKDKNGDEANVIYTAESKVELEEI